MSGLQDSKTPPKPAINLLQESTGGVQALGWCARSSQVACTGIVQGTRPPVFSSNVDPLFNNSLPFIGIIVGMLILRPEKHRVY